ncbi:MAG: hypothetical protein U9532_03040 ['Conium maculatum' witches'-broom phytoplasma]|nr:hypothetical protein ['Conium maculatum' witches'-broom phytoplasma]
MPDTKKPLPYNPFKIHHHSTYYEILLEMTYAEICHFLKLQHGPVPKSYFTNAHCLTKTPGITRAKKEGLFIHHIDESKAPLLSDPQQASQNPFAYQQADRLVYCNLLEHLILHTKLLYEFNQGKEGITSFLIPELNTIYSGNKFPQAWKNGPVTAIVKPWEKAYFQTLTQLKEYGYQMVLPPLETVKNLKKVAFYQKLHQLGLALVLKP